MTRRPNVIGLDLSITATGIAHADGSTETVGGSSHYGDARLDRITGRVSTALSAEAIDLVVIEDLPVHGHGAGITGMVQGVVRALLLRCSVPYALVPPASLKKYATGKGNSAKGELRMALFKRLGLDLPDDNQCDAWWLRAMGLDHLGAPVLDMPATHLLGLRGVVWPDDS